MSMTAYGATQAKEHARIPLIEALQTMLAASLSRGDPNVWSGRVSQEVFFDLAV
jgi:hypothetical protein